MSSCPFAIWYLIRPPDPLVVCLANTNEVFYLVNRCGNVVSHESCGSWIDRAIQSVAPHAGQIRLRGDTDFTLAGELDRWDGQGVLTSRVVSRGPQRQAKIGISKRTSPHVLPPLRMPFAASELRRLYYPEARAP